MPTLDEIRKEMAALPAREKANDQSAKQKIVKLREAIKHLHFDKDWKWDEIALWLSERDIKITEGTLRLYYYSSGHRKHKVKENSTAEADTSLAPEVAPKATPSPPRAAGAPRTFEGKPTAPAVPQRPAPAGRVNAILE